MSASCSGDQWPKVGAFGPIGDHRVDAESRESRDLGSQESTGTSLESLRAHMSPSSKGACPRQRRRLEQAEGRHVRAGTRSACGPGLGARPRASSTLAIRKTMMNTALMRLSHPGFWLRVRSGVLRDCGQCHRATSRVAQGEAAL